MMKKKWISSIIGCCLCFMCTAQTAGYHYYSLLDSVSKSGYYNIVLTPSIQSRLKTDFSDIRVADDSGRWVPHVLHTPSQERAVESVIFQTEFSSIENSSKQSTVIINNTSLPVSGFTLHIANTMAQRFCTISGSNDKKNWFVINDSILLQPVTDEAATKSDIDLKFPSCNYRFLKLIIYNNGKDPFNIIGISQRGSAIIRSAISFLPNPVTSIVQKDSGKFSYIKIQQADSFHTGSIRLLVSGVHFYSRRAVLYLPTGNVHSFADPGKEITSFTISNNSTMEFTTPLIQAQTFYLIIQNEDNLPLHLDSVQTFSRYHFITTYLEKGKHYRLLLNNAAATAPKYDMENNIKISDSAAFIQTGLITAIPEASANASNSIYGNNQVLWVIIIAVLIVMLFFTQKMLKEVNKKNSNDHL